MNRSFSSTNSRSCPPRPVSHSPMNSGCPQSLSCAQPKDLEPETWKSAHRGSPVPQASRLHRDAWAGGRSRGLQTPERGASPLTPIPSPRTARTSAKRRKKAAKNALGTRILHAFKHKSASLREILNNLCARRATFLAAFAQSGVVRAVNPSAQRNRIGQHSRKSATL
jgi:hypothetical protein